LVLGRGDGLWRAEVGIEVEVLGVVVHPGGYLLQLLGFLLDLLRQRWRPHAR
jgi:hypothetical protein